MSKSSAAEQGEGAIFIPPAPLESFPRDAWAALQHPHMRQGAPRQMPKDSPPWAYLDDTQNIDANCAAVTRAANEVFDHPWGPRQESTSLTVGIPGEYGLYLPIHLDFLAPLAAKAAGVAALNGELGVNCIQLQFTRFQRPIYDTAWHTDDHPTHLICADYAGTVLAAEGASLPKSAQRGWGKVPASAKLISVRSGVPVAFNQIIHSGPFQYPAVSYEEMEKTSDFHNTVQFRSQNTMAYYRASWCPALKSKLDPIRKAYL